MAWFDYARGLGAAAGQGLQQFGQLRQQGQQQQRQRMLDALALGEKRREMLKEQLSLLSPDQDLTAEEAKPYIEAFGASAFTKGEGPRTLRRKLTPEQEVTYGALAENRATRAAKQTLQKAIDDGSIESWSDAKIAQVTRQAGVDALMTPGIFGTSERAQKFGMSVPKVAIETSMKMQQLQQQLAIAQAKAESAMLSANQRAEAAANAANIRVEMAKLQADQRAALAEMQANSGLQKTLLESRLKAYDYNQSALTPETMKQILEDVNKVVGTAGYTLVSGK